MRVIQFDRYGDPDVLHAAERERPVPSPDQVLIRIMGIGVNPADCKWRRGMFAKHVPLSLPHVPGYDVAGIVEEPGTSGFAKGDHVAALLPPHAQGAYAEWVAADADRVALVPSDLDFAVAASIPTAGLTGVQMIEEQLDVKAGQTVLITGATGAVGRAAVHAAKARGAKVVAGVRAAYGDAALVLGADEVAILGNDWNGGTFDAVADTVGGEAVVSLCRHLREGGLIRTVSTAPIPASDLPAKPEFFSVHADSDRLAALAVEVAVGKLAMPIAKRLPLEEAAEAHRLTEAGKLMGKVILELRT